MNWFGIKRKPCEQLLGIFIFGPQHCDMLTFKRRRIEGEFVPDCGCHDYAALEEQRKGYTREVGSKQPMTKNVEDVFNWHEIALSDCDYGCKIYENAYSKERVLAHNSAYGCLKERV